MKQKVAKRLLGSLGVESRLKVCQTLLFLKTIEYVMLYWI